MGKPSSRTSRRSSSVKSNQSVVSESKKMPPMNSKEWRKVNNNNEARIRQSITGLFNKLRKKSTSINNNSTSSVIVLDDSTDSLNSKKRKMSTLHDESVKKKRLTSDSVVEIKDDDSIFNNSTITQTPKKTLPPMHSSTPNDKLSDNIKVAETKMLHKDIVNLTKEINSDSYLTIDLTYNSEDTKTENNTVIDLDKTTDNTFPNVVEQNSTITQDPEVTMVEKSALVKQSMQKLAANIGKLNSSEKCRLLELLTDNIINGCKYNSNIKRTIKNEAVANQSTETVEDNYIKEIIVGGAPSQNSIGSNVYNPQHDTKNKVGLRMIVIDGSNVAMEHHKGRGFSVKGLKICIDYFLRRGHVVKAFVPRFRCKFGKSSNPRLLDELERMGYVVYTPSREVQGKTITSYDDRYIIQCAAEFDGVIVSGDNYRDLMHENPKWKYVIENRLLPFTWVEDMIMFPKDPLGRNGPTLEEFLRHSTQNLNTNFNVKRVLEAAQSGTSELIQKLKESLSSNNDDGIATPASTQSPNVQAPGSTNGSYNEALKGTTFQIHQEVGPSLQDAQAMNKKKKNKAKRVARQKRLQQRKLQRICNNVNSNKIALGANIQNKNNEESGDCEIIDLNKERSPPDFISIIIDRDSKSRLVRTKSAMREITVIR